MATPAAYIACSMCHFRISTIPEWISHLRLVHSNDSGFNVTCGINECRNNYRKCASFITHVYRCHRDVIIQSKRKKSTIPNTCENSEGTMQPFDSGMESESSPHVSVAQEDLLTHTVHQILGTDDLEQRKKSALFILHLKEIKGLSESAVQSVITSYQGMLEHSIQRIHAGVNERVSSCGIKPDDLKLDDFFNNVSNPFDGLHTVYLQEKFYSEHLGCIVSLFFEYHSSIAYLVTSKH